MFYPCEVALGDRGSVKQALVVLTPAESRRLLAKAVAALPEVQGAHQRGRLAILSGGTTSFVLEEVTGEKFTVPGFSMGMSVDGMLTSSLPEGRVNGRCFVEGRMVDIPYPEFVKTMGRGIAGSEGAVILLLEGAAEELGAAVRLVESVKGEPRIEVPRHQLNQAAGAA